MSTDVTSLPDDPAQLKALLAHERQQHQQVVAQHEQLVAQHEQVVSQFAETIEKQQRTIRQQEHTIAQLLRRVTGRKQERIDPDQLLLFSAEELEAIARELEPSQEEEQEEDNAADATVPRRRRGHGRRPLPKHLPRERVVYELSDKERLCPCCGKLRQPMGEETSEQLEFIPASFKVIEHVRIKYACRNCQENVTVSPKPPQPIDKGLPGPGLLAHTVLSKYGDHTPLYRQEDIFTRHGIVLRRSTLCGWVAAAADLTEPLYERMCQLVRQSKVLHTDDTSVKLLDPLLGEARTAYFWAYIGDAKNPYSVYDFTTSHQRDGPAKFLNGFQGYLQADAYGGYDGIYLESGGKIVEVACWTHCRRYWWEARTSDSRRAHEALAYIARLYQVEDQLTERTAKERHAARQQYALPILTEFRGWIDKQLPAVLPKSPLAAAIIYTTNQWKALVRYVEDADLLIDNNISERTVKIPAIGRKNWLFVASETGGRRAAILFSLIASCKANQVEPWAYLRDLFTCLPTQPTDALDDLLPDRWLSAHPEHRWQIDELRQQERQRKRRTSGPRTAR
jgi:transposase